MPSNYAHHDFGNRVWRSMPPHLRRYVQVERSLFGIGQHGPDILFYYMAMGHNSVNAIGYGTHDRTGADFFSDAAQAWLALGGRRRCCPTFWVWSVILPWMQPVTGMWRRKSRKAVRVTSRLRWSLTDISCVPMADPLRHRLTRHICPTNDRAAMIAPVYPPLKPEEVLHALLAMKFYDFLLTGQSRWKRGLVDVGMRLTGNYESMRYMKIGRTPAAICADSNLRLNKLMNRAIPEARRAIEDFLAYCLNGKALPPFFDRTFGAGEGWSQIPVLPYEEEIYYEV